MLMQTSSDHENNAGFILFHFHQDGLGRPSHAHPMQQQGLISRETRLH